MNKPTDAVDTQVVELKRQMVVSLARIDPALLVGFGHEIDLKSFADFITEELVAKLTARGLSAWRQSECPSGSRLIASLHRSLPWTAGG